MAKIYGERWQISSEKPLGRGGQAEVFRVTDTRGEFQGEHALKRVLNPSRHDRFKREIEAIRTVQHPNIIKLIDHSALGAASGDAGKQFLVMPIADGGDLGQPGRVDLYRDSIDATVQVGKQLAFALTAAHDAGIIHRDIKPANVLFTGIGHEVWLSDFGICLLRENTRLTDPEEVVGPRAFLAPELEDGGQLDVTPAADIYSLGKVLYYMISGGVIIPRERLDEGQYNQLFSKGERHRLLQLLLRQMICPLSGRLQSMTEVAKRLSKIETWEKEAQVLPLTSQAIASINKLQLQAEESIRVAAENRTAREQEAQRLDTVKKAFLAWTRAEFEKVAAYINEAKILGCKIDDGLSGPVQNLNVAVPPSSSYASIAAIGLNLERIAAAPGARHVLQISLCIMRTVTITTTIGPPKPQIPVPELPKDHSLTMIPYYQRITDARPSSQLPPMGFFTKRSAVGQVKGVHPYPVQGRPGRTQLYTGPISTVTAAFAGGVSQSVSFRMSEWPAAIELLRPALQEALESFIGFVESGGLPTGP